METFLPMPFVSLNPVLQALVVYFLVLLPTLLFASDPRNPAAPIRSVLLQFFVVALVPLVFTHLLRHDRRAVFSLRAVSARNLLWCCVLALSAVFLLDEVTFWQVRLTGVQANVGPEIQNLLRADSVLNLSWTFFAFSLTPAI